MKIHADVHCDKSPLSPTENKIFALMAEGLSRPEMSARLHRSLSTINTHFNHIFQKLDADNSTNAVVIGVIKGILSFKTLLIYGLIISSVGGLLAPSPAQASKEGQQPIVRVRVRGSGRIQSGGKLQLRTATRKKES
jgi:DNA-binding CsgD family transcriptional regulator